MKNAVRSLACVCTCLFTLASFAALPSGYTELKSVGFTGQQYVDLGYSPTTENFGFTLDLVYTGKVSKTAGEYCPVLGSSLKNQGYFGGITVSGYASTGGGQMTFCRDSVHHVMYDPCLVPGKRCFYELRKRGWSMRQYGGGTNSTTTLSTPFSQDVFYGSLYLGAIHNDASEPSANGCLRGIVHRMTLYDGLTVVADFVPARDGEGRVGLYDVVGDLGFRQSASATPLVAGAELVLPEGYEELTYVDFTGSQYVDTLYTPATTNFGFSLDFIYYNRVSTLSGEYAQILGSSYKNNGAWGGVTLGGFQTHPGGQMTFCAPDSGLRIYDPELVSDIRQVCEIKKSVYTHRVGTTTTTLAFSNSTVPTKYYGSFYLGAVHNDSGAPAATGLLRARVYRLKLFYENRMTADFVPVKDGEGRVGLYDIAGDLGFRQSASETPLVAGPAITGKNNTLSVDDNVAGLGGFSPSTTNYTLTVGRRYRITAKPKVVHPTSGQPYVCTGWTLLDRYGEVVTNAVSCLFEYRQTEAYEGDSLTLTWQWTTYDPALEAIPSDYEPIEYVASDFTQYLDTELESGPTTRFVVDFRLPLGNTMASGKTASRMGWGNGNKHDSFLCGIINDDTLEAGATVFYSSVGSTWTARSVGKHADAVRHTFDLGPGRQAFDGTVYANDDPAAVYKDPTATPKVPKDNSHMYLFALGAGWNAEAGDNPMTAEIYSCQIYTNDVLIADMRPVRKVSEGPAYTSAAAYGFYDLVRQRYFTAQSVGSPGTAIALSGSTTVLNKILPKVKDRVGFALVVK